MDKLQTATFAAGCFWGVEESFRQLSGVKSTQVGYTAGNLANPDYRAVCNGDTGHAEAVEVIFDPETVTYSKLLQVFFENHDPTTLNRQGPDVGSQYRSGIYFHSEEQKHQAEVFRDELEKSGRYRKPLVTEIIASTPFYKAEEYHQQYLLKRGLANCHI